MDVGSYPICVIYDSFMATTAAPPSIGPIVDKLN